MDALESKQNTRNKRNKTKPNKTGKETEETGIEVDVVVTEITVDKDAVTEE